MYSIENSIEKLYNECLSFGQVLESPSSKESIDFSIIYYIDFLKSPIPDGQIEIWKKTNGLELNGFFWYKSCEKNNISNDIPIFNEVNNLYYNFYEENIIFYGESDIDYYIFNKIKNKYFVVSKVTLDEFREFNDFNGFFCFCTDKCLNDINGIEEPNPHLYDGKNLSD